MYASIFLWQAQDLYVSGIKRFFLVVCSESNTYIYTQCFLNNSLLVINHSTDQTEVVL